MNSGVTERFGVLRNICSGDFSRLAFFLNLDKSNKINGRHIVLD